MKTDCKTVFDSYAKKYDLIFEKLIEYEKELCNGLESKVIRKYNVRNILDCACGTGCPSVELAKRGFYVVASDISSNMIKEAVKKAKRRQIKIVSEDSEIKPQESRTGRIRYVCSSWQNLTKNIKGSFDLVLCRGNSLFYVPKEEVVASLKQMYQMLSDNGVLYIDSFDWDELLSNRRKLRCLNRKCGKGKKITQALGFNEFITYNGSDCVVQTILVQEIGFKDNFLIKSELYPPLEYFPIREEEFVEILIKVGLTNVRKEDMPEERLLKVFIGEKK